MFQILLKLQEQQSKMCDNGRQLLKKFELVNGNRMCPQSRTNCDIFTVIIQKICSLKYGGRRKACYTGNERIISDMRTTSSRDPGH